MVGGQPARALLVRKQALTPPPPFSSRVPSNRAGLSRNSICITPLRKGAMLACVFSFFFALFFQVLHYGALLSVSEETAPPVFLQMLYWLQLLFGVGVLALSITTYVALYTQHARLMSGGCSMPLLFSRLLRYGMWLSLFAFFFVWFRSNEACGVIEKQGSQQLAVAGCRCMKEQGVARDVDLDWCKPKDYHICESPLVDTLPSLERDSLSEDARRELLHQINMCRWCGLNLDGDLDGDHVIDHVPCTPNECTDMNCRYETKTCPAKQTDFDDEIDELEEAERAFGVGLNIAMRRFASGQQVDECHYDEEGRLTSLNITARIEQQPQSAVDYYIDTGVLRLTHGADSGLDWALERGGSVFGNISDINAGLNSSATQGDCAMDVRQVQLEADILEHECWVIITTGNVMLNLLTAVMSYHYSRVFYSLYVNDCAPSRGDTGHVRMDDVPGGSLGGDGGSRARP